MGYWEEGIYKKKSNNGETCELFSNVSLWLGYIGKGGHICWDFNIVHRMLPWLYIKMTYIHRIIIWEGVHKTMVIPI